MSKFGPCVLLCLTVGTAVGCGSERLRRGNLEAIGDCSAATSGWEVRAAPSVHGGFLSTVVSDGLRFISGGFLDDDHALAYLSEDGVCFEKTAPPMAGWLRAITWSDGVLVGSSTKYGDGSVFWRSTNGVEWTRLGTLPWRVDVLKELAPSTWLAVGDEGRMAVSSLLDRFVEVAPPLGPDLYAVAGSDRLVAVGESIYYTEGVDRWSRAATPARGVGAVQSLRGVAFGAAGYVAVGDTGEMHTSPDGISWTLRRPPGSGPSLNGIAYGGGHYVAVGDAGTVLTSTDGMLWTTQAIGVTASLQSVACAGGRVVAVGAGATIVSTR